MFLHAVRNFVNKKTFSSKHVSTFLSRKYDVISQFRHSYTEATFCVTRLIYIMKYRTDLSNTFLLIVYFNVLFAIFYWKKIVKQHITDTHIYYRKQSVEINTNLIRFFIVNAIIILFDTKSCMHPCNRNLILLVWSAVPIIKMLWKRQNVNILTILQVHRRRFLTILADPRLPESLPRLQQSGFAEGNLSRLDKIWTKCSSMWFSFFFGLSDFRRSQANPVCENDWLFGKQLFYEYPNDEQHH